MEYSSRLDKGGKGGTEDGTNRKQLAKYRPISNYISKYINLSWINTLQLKAQNYQAGFLKSKTQQYALYKRQVNIQFIAEQMFLICIS